MSLGDFAISEQLFDYILRHLPKGSTILEFGSGDGSAELAKHYKVYSVEHDEEWMGKYDTVNYIYAPIKEHKEVKKLNGKFWYDWSVLKPQLEGLAYDLILVDGPPIRYGRAGFVKYMIPPPDSTDPWHTPIIFDDLHRMRDMGIALKVSARLKTPLTVHDTWEPKTWGVIGKFPIPPTYLTEEELRSLEEDE